MQRVRMAEMVVRRGFGLQVDSNAVARAEGEIVSSQDTEVAALTGISLALFDAKASNEGIDFVQKVGLRILHALPSKMVDQTTTVRLKTPANIADLACQVLLEAFDVRQRLEKWAFSRKALH